MNEELGVNTLDITFVSGAFEAAFDQVFLTLVELFLASSFAFIPVVHIDLVSEIGESEIGDRDDAGHPDDQFEQTKDHKIGISQQLTTNNQ